MPDCANIILKPLNHLLTNEILISDYIVVSVCFFFFELFVFLSIFLHSDIKPVAVVCLFCQIIL